MRKYWSFKLLTLRSTFSSRSKQSALLLLATLNLCTPRLAEAGHPTTHDPGGTLIAPRFAHTATRLLDGRVLVAGGKTGDFYTYTGACEIYDPGTHGWMSTGSLNNPRGYHGSTLLPDGRVLAMGGIGLLGSVSYTEIYDPATGVWTNTNPMITARTFFEPVVLADGRVLVAGGSYKIAACEIYDPVTGTWSATGNLLRPRRNYHATLLDNGTVVLAGGFSDGSDLTGECELFDPATGTWSDTGALGVPRVFHVQVKLADGRVLAAGGDSRFIPRQSTVTETAEIYDPATGLWSPTGSLNTARANFTANLLENGSVFAAGGDDGTALSYNSIEIFNPRKGRWRTSTETLAITRRLHTTTTLLDGSLIIGGGKDSANHLIPSTELFVRPR